MFCAQRAIQNFIVWRRLRPSFPFSNVDLVFEALERARNNDRQKEQESRR